MRRADASRAIAARLPRVHVERDLLDLAEHDALLADTLANETQYRPSLVNSYREGVVQRGEVNENTRLSGCRTLETKFTDIFKSRVCERRERISEAIGVLFPEPHQFEIEAVYSGDRAFFSRHIDTTVGQTGRYRVISAVYYYFAAPRRFSGGELKIYSLDQTQSVVVEPENNMMVFFPSIFVHEVLPVSVPSQTFEAGRFSVNCWVHHRP